MVRLASWLTVGLAALGLVFVLATAGQLPERVATHFGPGGIANGWMTRDGYRLLAMALVVLLPLSSLAVTTWISRDPRRITRLPHRDFWLAPERREETMATLRGFGGIVGVLGALFAIGLHVGILSANAKSPPRLDEPMFIAGTVLFGAATLIAVVGLRLRFRRKAS
jgi:uncharacterized membrane protein